MIVRDDIAAETYEPLPFSPAEYRRLRKAFRDHSPEVALDRGPTDTGLPFLIVGDPSAGFDDAWPIITRGERGWQMSLDPEGPLYEFATEREAAEFSRVRGLTSDRLDHPAGARSPGTAAPTSHSRHPRPRWWTARVLQSRIRRLIENRRASRRPSEFSGR